MSAKVYNADQVTVAYGPVLLGSGQADGEFLRVEQEADDFEDVVGSGGEVVRSKTNDRRATVTVILLQTASENDLLSALHAVQRETGLGSEPLLIKDQNGRAIYKAEQAWIMRGPDASFDRSATSREWAIRCADLVRFDGGNATI